jgi:cytochrome c biogenesis protein
MRTALFLLFLLAIGAVPGSVVPQRGVNPGAVLDWQRANPGLAPWFERLSLFDVYAAPWFAAIYLLLLVSLIGCVVPRSRAHWRALRQPPPPAPLRLGRLPVHGQWEMTAPPEVVLTAARDLLRGERWRVARPDAAGADAVSAEKGYLREVGNLVFHLSLILLLLAVAYGSAYGWRGGKLLVEGQGFAGALTAYDTLESGALVDRASLPPFVLGLQDLAVTYAEHGQQAGSPRDFTARTTVRERPGAPTRERVLQVNSPLALGGGTKAFLIGNGYAPIVTVRDSAGQVAFAGPVPFLPQDGNNTSTGVIKVSSSQPEQLGFQGALLPTARADNPVSVFPDLGNPRLFLTAFRGDLGVDAGLPQSVYRLDTTRMQQIESVDGRPFAASPGDVLVLPDGQGSVTFDGVARWASLSIAHDPGRWPSLLAAVAAIAGLTLSLFIRHRRVWVRARAGEGGRTVVEVAGLGRTDAEGLREELTAFAETLRESAGSAPARPTTSRTSEE